MCRCLAHPFLSGPLAGAGRSLPEMRYALSPPTVKPACVASVGRPLFGRKRTLSVACLILSHRPRQRDLRARPVYGNLRTCLRVQKTVAAEPVASFEDL